MRLVVTTFLVGAAAVQLIASQQRPPGRLFRGPFISQREAVLVRPDRPLPIEFEGARLYLDGPAPWAEPTNARLESRVRSNTLRPVSARGITLRVAVGPSDHGMFTFRMRGVGVDGLVEDPHRIPSDGVARPVTFAGLPGQPYPGLVLLNLATKIVFTLERLEGDDAQLIFENPDATELLWEALGRPSLSSQ